MHLPLPTKLSQLTISSLLFAGYSPAQCTSQGAGNCNLGFIGVQPVTNLGWVSWEQAIIYDNACNPIGYYNNPYQGIAIDSQLPYTVVLMTLNTEGYYDTIGMAYAGYSFTGILLATVRMDPLGITTTTYVMLSLVMDLSPTKRVNFLINLKLDPFSRPSETLEGCLEVMLRR